jgi:hypothetical protein
MISALEISNEICRQSKDESVEAANAYGMFSFVVAKARKAQRMIAEQQQGSGPSNATGQSFNADTTAPVSEWWSTEAFDDILPDFDWVRDIDVLLIYSLNERTA